MNNQLELDERDKKLIVETMRVISGDPEQTNINANTTLISIEKTTENSYVACFKNKQDTSKYTAYEIEVNDQIITIRSSVYNTTNNNESNEDIYVIAYQDSHKIDSNEGEILLVKNDYAIMECVVERAQKNEKGIRKPFLTGFPKIKEIYQIEEPYQINKRPQNR